MKNELEEEYLSEVTDMQKLKKYMSKNIIRIKNLHLLRIYMKTTFMNGQYLSIYFMVVLDGAAQILMF